MWSATNIPSGVLCHVIHDPDTNVLTLDLYDTHDRDPAHWNQQSWIATLTFPAIPNFTSTTCADSGVSLSVAYPPDATQNSAATTCAVTATSGLLFTENACVESGRVSLSWTSTLALSGGGTQPFDGQVSVSY